MKKVLTALLCIFLALLLISCAVYPKKSLQGTIDGLKNDFYPVYTAYNLLSNFVEDYLLPQKAEIVEGVVSGGVHIDMKNYIEAYARDFLISMDWFGDAIDQDFLTSMTFNINLHDEHKVCLIKIEGYEKSYRFCYCAICNKVIAIFTTKPFQFYKNWIWPLVDGKITADYNFSIGAYDLTSYYADYINSQ